MKNPKHIIVMSADALVFEDMEYLRTLPNCAYAAANGATVDKMRSIYPTITYPAHVSMATGAYPNKHGLVNNNQLKIGMAKDIPWEWFADAVKIPDIFTAAKRAGKSTAAVFWPVTGNHPDIDYLIDEYWPQKTVEGDTIEACLLRSGTTRELFDEVVKPLLDRDENFKIRTHPATEELICDAACEIIRRYKPNLLMIHPANIDAYRHKGGVFPPNLKKGIEETDSYLGRLMDAAREAGIFEDTSFLLVSDHGQMDIKRSIKPNVIFADNGLIKVGENGELQGWDAWCHSAGMSAQIWLREPGNAEIYEKTYNLLKHMRDEGIYGISEVYTTAEINDSENLSGGFSFVLETDGYTSFANEWTRPLVKEFDLSDYRFGRATHGYHPSKGPQPTLVACGAGIKQGAAIENGRIIDIAPTIAKLFGIDLPDADGSALDIIN